jgi:hypothetical protein
MNIAVKLSIASSVLASMAIPALAGVNVNYPANHSQVESQFKVSATSIACSSEDVAVMGYSLDGSGDDTFVEGTSLETTITAPPGVHTVHIKAWSTSGTLCVTDVEVTVAKSNEASLVPDNAIVNSDLQALSSWKATHDTKGAGRATGTTKLVSSPALKGSSRMFESDFEGSGDMRYSLDFGDDSTSTNFFYDNWVYLTKDSHEIGVIEMDMNQVIPNGKTVIYGFQCDGWNGKWDYAGNTHGTKHPYTGWISSGKPCNPRDWKIDTWHHIQVSYSRNATGTVTYDYVIFDGDTIPIHRTVFSAYAIGWGRGKLITNFQVDGYGAKGSNTAYIDELSISRW